MCQNINIVSLVNTLAIEGKGAYNGKYSVRHILLLSLSELEFEGDVHR